MVSGKEPSRKLIAAGVFLSALVLLMVVVPNSIVFNKNNAEKQFRLERDLAANDVHAIQSDSNFFKYAYVFVTYHKSGHVLSRHLVNYLQKNLAFHFGSRLTKGERVVPRRDFNAYTKCTNLSLKPGTVTIIDAPQFHCKVDELRHLFMNNPEPTHKKFGVKVIHLVRNPFSMAVSNYHYHSLDPAPEPFVNNPEVNPCESLNGSIGPGNDVKADLVTQKLTNTEVEVAGETKPIMTREDFTNIVQDCYSMWRTRPGLTDGTYFDHLSALDPREGVRMATADKFIHFTLLANDLIMFDRVERKVHERNVDHPGKRNDFDLLTMSLDDWIERPDQSMYDFLDFIFHNHMPENRKHAQAALHKKEYLAKASHPDDVHITSGKHSDTDELVQSLRDDAVFGGILARMEVLFESFLHQHARS
mmetsp:Transcript_4037/g.9080  ORF Transcript_4037/g.9080 Transcript_4037/m.9080 type:complete len:418 (+) Transcript_4037:198-1451(+)